MYNSKEVKDFIKLGNVLFKTVTFNFLATKKKKKKPKEALIPLIKQEKARETESELLF